MFENDPSSNMQSGKRERSVSPETPSKRPKVTLKLRKPAKKITAEQLQRTQSHVEHETEAEWCARMDSLTQHRLENLERMLKEKDAQIQTLMMLLGGDRHGSTSEIASMPSDESAKDLLDSLLMPPPPLPFPRASNSESRNSPSQSPNDEDRDHENHNHGDDINDDYDDDIPPPTPEPIVAWEIVNHRRLY